MIVKISLENDQLWNKSNALQLSAWFIYGEQKDSLQKVEIGDKMQLFGINVTPMIPGCV